jgi:DNA-binding response OmpR family regulator
MLIINQASWQVLLSSSEIELTTNEFELLWFLASHAGEVISRDQILMAVRGIEYDGLDRWVDIRISRLRNKLNDDAEHPQKIKTVWGKGYLFVEDAWQC